MKIFKLLVKMFKRENVWETRDPNKIIDFMMDKNLINKKMNCSKCNLPMILQAMQGGDKKVWRCKKCTTKKSIKTASFFEFARLLLPMLKLIFNFINNINQSTTEKETNLARQTVSDYYHRFR